MRATTFQTAQIETARRGDSGPMGGMGPQPDNRGRPMTYNVTANRSSFCPHCQQPMPQLRCGVKMYPQAAAVFDAIARAGAAGIDGHDLFEIAWQGKRKPKYGTL